MSLNIDVCQRCLMRAFGPDEGSLKWYTRRGMDWMDGCVRCAPDGELHWFRDGIPEECPYAAEHAVSFCESE